MYLVYFPTLIFTVFNGDFSYFKNKMQLKLQKLPDPEQTRLVLNSQVPLGLNDIFILTFYSLLMSKCGLKQPSYAPGTQKY